MTAVEFAAPDAGEAPLTWGQTHLWRAVDEFPGLDAGLNIRRSFRPEPEVAVPAALSAVRRLAERHQAVRTHVRRGDDGPRQVVAGTGTIPVEVITVPSSDVDAALAAAVDRLAGTAFRLDRAWPVRLVLVCAGDRVRGVGLAGSHIVLDGWAMQLLTDELRDLLAGAEPADVPWQPLDQAREERSERGQRLQRKTLRFWARNLAAAPATAFAGPPGPDRALPMCRWRLESPAVAAVVPVLARRIGVSTSTVLLTAGALIIRALTGTERVALKVVAGNRTTPRQRSLVANAAQDGLFVLGAPGPDVAATARQVYRDATEAYYYAAADPYALARTIREAAGEPDLSLFFNDARLGCEWPETLLDEVSRPAVEKLRGRSRIVAADRSAASDMKLMLAVSHAPEHAGVTLLADLRHVPEEKGRQAVRAFEALLCEALLRPLPTAEIAALIDAQSAADPSK